LTGLGHESEIYVNVARQRATGLALRGPGAWLIVRASLSGGGGYSARRACHCGAQCQWPLAAAAPVTAPTATGLSQLPAALLPGPVRAAPAEAPAEAPVGNVTLCADCAGQPERSSVYTSVKATRTVGATQWVGGPGGAGAGTAACPGPAWPHDLDGGQYPPGDSEIRARGWAANVGREHHDLPTAGCQRRDSRSY
jgi:hypothetical protein